MEESEPEEKGKAPEEAARALIEDPLGVPMKRPVWAPGRHGVDQVAQDHDRVLLFLAHRPSNRLHGRSGLTRISEHEQGDALAGREGGRLVAGGGRYAMGERRTEGAEAQEHRQDPCDRKSIHHGPQASGMSTGGQSIDRATVVTTCSSTAAHCGCVDPRGMRGGRLHLPPDE